MAVLQDLIPDPTTKNLWQCRPAATPTISFGASGFSSGFSSGFGGSGFVNATFISCVKVIGTRVYGMVTTTRNPGRDEPFCYDIARQVFIPISGVTALNTPLSPATSGPWNPPSMDLIGSKIIVAHPGFTGVNNAFFGVIDLTTPTTPAWSATNTSQPAGAAPVVNTALIAPPQWVQNFGGRCFFLVNPPNAQPGAYMSDELDPTHITNGNQVLTFNDNVPLTCAVGLPLSNQLGGIIQSLIVFKSATNMYQVTGDYSLGTLAVNALNVATGTFAPNTVVSTSKGLAFIAPDGLRYIDFNAQVSDPVGHEGEGVTVPFINAIVPSRMCAAYNSGVYRVQVQNGIFTGTPQQQQWWFDFVRAIWSGPHTQRASLMQPYAGTFIVTLQNAAVATLFQSDPVQSSTSTFVENGQQLSWQWGTPMLPDTDQMAEVAMIETTLHMALVPGNNVTVTAQDQNGAVFDTVTVVPAGSPTIWGAFTWGQALWQGTLNLLYPRLLSWHLPIVFRRMSILATGVSAPGVKIGRLHLRYQVLGYIQQGG